MMDTATARPLRRWPVLAFGVALLFISRYAASPAADFVLDDWADLNQAGHLSSYGQIWQMVAREADRPLCLGTIASTFRALGDRPELFALLNLATYSLAIVLLGLCAFALRGQAGFAMLTVSTFALLPNTGEAFRWHHQAAIGYINVAYLACLYLWILHLKRPAWWRLALSAACYGIALFTYETGALIPAALCVLLPRLSLKNLRTPVLVFGAVLAANLMWRFGLLGGAKEHLVNGRDYVGHGPRLYDLYWNGCEIARWWVGGHMFDAVREGWNGFALAAPWLQRRLVMLDGITIGLLLIAFRTWLAGDSRGAPGTPSCWSGGRLALFALVWASATHAVSLLSWTGSRLNFLPAAGVSWLAALVLCKWERKAWMPLYAALALACLLANQGTALSWREAGLYNRRIYEFLGEQASHWRGKSIVFFDTRGVRQKLTPGLTRPPSASASIWPSYQNAGLFRGIAPTAMLGLLAHGPDEPSAIVDVENGARIVGDQLHWHSRFNPGETHVTALSDVYVVDCLAAVQR